MMKSLQEWWRSRSLPTLVQPVSQLCTESQMREAIYPRWCTEFHEVPVLHRKQWEYVYCLQTLDLAGLLKEGSTGLGFGVGQDPLSATLAKWGCKIVATDVDPVKGQRLGWLASNQLATGLEVLNKRNICPAEKFARRVSFRVMDMTALSPDLRNFDFVWSSCSLEHLGSLEAGLHFIRESLHCLRPGGLAVHTTEFNVFSNTHTIDHEGVVLYRRKDLKALQKQLALDGHHLEFNWNSGDQPLDRYYDMPPFRNDYHLKLMLQGFVTTSIGLTIKKAG